MTTSQTIAIDYDDEMKSTRKLLERVPLDDAHRNYKPHEKSMPLDLLATHVAEIPGWTPAALTGELYRMEADYQPRRVSSTAELLELFDKSAQEGRACIQAATDEQMEKNWTFQFGDQFSFTEVRTKVLRSFINHLIHHRAQLGVYLRLNGIPVPGMYGPSADEAVQ